MCQRFLQISDILRDRSGRAVSTGCLLVVLMLNACRSAEQIYDPPVRISESFSSGGNLPVPDKWWSQIDDPVLPGLIEQALAENLSFQSVWDRLDQAEAELRRAGAPLQPSLDAAAGAERSYRRDVDSEPGKTVESYSTDFSLGLAADYELDIWGRLDSLREAAEFQKQAAADDLQVTAITLSATVAITWYQFVEQQGQIRLLDDQIDTNQKVAELITLRFRRGQAAAADVIRQRQLVEARRGERITALANRSVLRHRLAVLLGQAPTEIQLPETTDFPEFGALPETGLPADLLQRRPDVRRAYHTLLAADRNLEAAITNQYPRISIQANVETSAERTRSLFDNWIKNLAANAVAPLFDGDLRKAEVQQNRAVVSERLHDYGQTILDALAEVEDALVLETRQREFIASLNRQLELAQESIDRIRDQYAKGATDYLDVLSALLTYQNLQRSALTARRVLIEDRIFLHRALAGGWELERTDLAENNNGKEQKHSADSAKLTQTPLRTEHPL